VKISESDVRYVAELAHLELTEEEVRRFTEELSAVLAYMDKLNELDTEGVEPMAQVLFEAEETATLREDVERETLGSETALANAPLAGAGYFKVPRVIER
jgi:aspartyl-tRNA(Asn)/glutamyl-tRNA(Gln) amidotransferase subunit C